MSDANEDPEKLSIIVPFLNEQDTLPKLIDEVEKAIAPLATKVELILVNDGSSDDSLNRVRGRTSDKLAISILSLSRNFGHQAAISAGLTIAVGDVTIIMDADLQDPPSLIPALIKEYKKGFDVVYVIRHSRSEPLLLRALYKAYYRCLRRMSSVDIPLDAGDFCLISKRIVGLLNSFSEVHVFHRGLRAWLGFQATGIEIDRPARQSGKSKYTLRRLVGLAMNGFLSFSVIPLRIVTLVGASAVALSGAFCMYALYEKLFRSTSPTGFTALTFLITFLAGLQLLCLGVIGEYLGRVYEQVKSRPKFVIDEILKIPSKNSTK